MSALDEKSTPRSGDITVASGVIPTVVVPVYLSPAQVCELIPGMTEGMLGQLRYTGKGPRFSKPSAKKVVYRADEIVAYLEGKSMTSTAEWVS